MKMKHQLNQALYNALKKLDVSVESIQLTPPKNPEFGDLSTNLALTLTKLLKKSPMEIAADIQQCLSVDTALISDITITPPGFINFRISPAYFQSLISQILKKGNQFGRGRTGENKTANVEFVSANPTGPLTVGHGRQAVLGDTVSGILEWHGYDVTREYYFNDAGRQMRMLGQSVEARYFQQLGQDISLPEDGYQGDYITAIAQNVLDTHGENLESGNPIFRKTAEDIIFGLIKSTLKNLGIIHDQFTNEKSFYESGAIDDTLQKLRDNNLIYEFEKATWFKTTALGKDQDRVLIKSTGEPTYRLPDMAYHRNKMDRNYDLVIDIFGADHIDTYPDVLSALDILGYDTEKVRVLIHQFVTLVRGGEKVKMSTRKGDYVTLDELTNEVGADVVRYFFIMRSMNSHLNFDLDLAKDHSDQNPVYYLHYAHARICNIIKHGESLGHKFTKDYNPSLLSHSSEISLLKQMDVFPEVMELALNTLEPQTIANYLQELATHFHKFYTDCKVITNDIPTTQARLALISAVRIVLANGLQILGLSTPERM